MRRRGGQSSSSSSVTEKQKKMALKQQTDEKTQEDDAVDERDDKVGDELSASLLATTSTRGKRRRERENKVKHKEMTEEEMMDFALRLSEQEASDTALRLQQEEEAMMKAIQESMAGQTLCSTSQSQSLLADTAAPLRLRPQRRLLYRKRTTAVDQGESEENETDLTRESKGTGYEDNNRNKKQEWKEGSPLPEMPDLSQTQASPCRSSSPSVALDSPQSSDSTQIDDCQLLKSPVFPLTGCKAEVHVPRLSQELLETCRTSGFVLCSQDSCTSTLKSPSARPQSPTFPKSPTSRDDVKTVRSKSPIFSDTDQGDDEEETELSPDCLKSPVFGKTTQRETSPGACKPDANVCKNSGFTFSTQESFSSSVRSTSRCPQSPMFPGSPAPPRNLPPSETSIRCKSLVFSETDGERTQQSDNGSSSPVFGCTRRRPIHVDPQEERKPSSSSDTDPDLQSLRTDKETDQRLNINTLSMSDDTQELKETNKDWTSDETELTSDMKLLWSDDDGDVAMLGTPSPVFPEEKTIHEDSSLNHEAAASPGTTTLNCSSKKHVSVRPSSSSTFTGRQQLISSEQEVRPLGNQTPTVDAASTPGGEPAVGSTVHYYWGVPFCPRGLDPDAYTQVIVAQMEVYTSSLKQAQRRLMRKVEWGEGIQPQPEKSPSPEPQPESPQHHVPRRHGLRLRGKRLREEAATPPAEEEEEEEEEGERREGEKKKEEEEKKNEGEEEHVDVEDCEVCPETQLSVIDDGDGDGDGDRTPELTIVADVGAERRPQSPDFQPESPNLQMILQGDSPAVGAEPQQQKEEEPQEDASVDKQTKGNCSSNRIREEVTERMEEPDVEEIDYRSLQRSTSPELELPTAAAAAAAAIVPQSLETSVDCPICQRSFPVTKIELHAAYCDGEVAVMEDQRMEVDRFQASLKPCRKRTRRADVTDEDANDSSGIGRNQEKCYICLKVVPLRDYGRHTERCIMQEKASNAAAKGKLLSALEQTETRESEAGPSGSRLQPGEVIDLRDDDDDDDDDDDGGDGGGRVDEDGYVSALRTNSPIRSFTPISEATDCLIDFRRQQRNKRPRQRRR